MKISKLKLKRKMLFKFSANSQHTTSNDNGKSVTLTETLHSYTR